MASPVQDQRAFSTVGGDIVVVGAGLAGLAAAVVLAQSGVGVTVVETGKRLGGRAGSFVDRATGERIDNCQHVVMRSCTHLLDLYERLGVAEKIDWHRRFYFVDGHGHIDTLEAGWAPAPLHMSRSLLGFSSLRVKEKLAIARAMFAVLRAGETGRAGVHDQSFAQWLARHRQPDGAIEKFWAPVIISACNEQPERVAADYALQVFQEGFLRHNRVQEMGVARIPLQMLYEPARAIIEKAGGRVLTGVSAEAFEFVDGRVTGLRLADGARLEATTFISTVPFDRLAKLISDPMRGADGRLQALDRFAVSPIIGIHLYFAADDGPIFDLPHVALTQSPLQWVFNKGIEAGRQHLHGVISGAHAWVDQPAAVIVRMAVGEIRQAFPRMVDAELVHHRVIKEKRATFSLAPGMDRYRPAATGAIANLILAGDWTATGWPATMEGAVRSGYRAANAASGSTDRVIVAEARRAVLYRLLAGT